MAVRAVVPGEGRQQGGDNRRGVQAGGPPSRRWARHAVQKGLRGGVLGRGRGGWLGPEKASRTPATCSSHRGTFPEPGEPARRLGSARGRAEPQRRPSRHRAGFADQPGATRVQRPRQVAVLRAHEAPGPGSSPPGQLSPWRGWSQGMGAGRSPLTGTLPRTRVSAAVTAAKAAGRAPTRRQGRLPPRPVEASRDRS